MMQSACRIKLMRQKLLKAKLYSYKLGIGIIFHNQITRLACNEVVSRNPQAGQFYNIL